MVSVLCAGCLVSATAFAQWQFSAGAGLRQVRVVESDRNGRQLVQEDGWLPGLDLRAEYAWQDYRFGVAGEIYRRDLGYQGSLQNGAPFSTDTETTLSRIRFDVTRRVGDHGRLMAGVEWDEWRRNILGRGAVLGLNERTRSWRLLAGGGARVLQSSTANVDLDASLVLAAPEKLSVSFQNRIYDDAQFSTRSAVGVRLALGVQPTAVPAMTISVDFDWLRVPRSDDAVLRRNGVAVGTLAQPEHSRRAFGIRMNYRF
jgi:hypothetical protein